MTARLIRLPKAVRNDAFYRAVPAISAGPPSRFPGVYCPQEEGTCCNQQVKQKPGTSSGLARLFPQWMNPAIPLQLFIAAFADDGSAQRMPRMKTGTLAFLCPATKAARLSYLPRRQALRGLNLGPANSILPAAYGIVCANNQHRKNTAGARTAGCRNDAH